MRSVWKKVQLEQRIVFLNLNQNGDLFPLILQNYRKQVIIFCTLFKGTVCLISRYSKCKDDNVRFTTVPLKPLSEQKCVLDEINNKIYISSSNPEIILFIRKKFHLTGNGYIGNRKLRMSAKSIMTAAEKLYTQGFISYPRQD